MRIGDYETGRELRDVSICLTKEEAGDMIAYLQRLVKDTDVVRVHLSEVKKLRIERELTFALEEGGAQRIVHPVLAGTYAAS
jgi:hypothetical protein